MRVSYVHGDVRIKSITLINLQYYQLSPTVSSKTMELHKSSVYEWVTPFSPEFKIITFILQYLDTYWNSELLKSNYSQPGFKIKIITS